MIEKVVEKWHQFIRGKLPGGLDELIAEDCSFYSPIVFSAQRGRELTKLYLTAAGATFGGESVGAAAAESAVGSKFRYVKQTFGENHAILEFETELGGTYINGVDILTCDEDGRIVEFKVMVRPLRAVNLLHQRMAAMLEKLKAGAGA